MLNVTWNVYEKDKRGSFKPDPPCIWFFKSVWKKDYRIDEAY